MKPKPGYKQTDVGVIPEDWDAGRLGEKTTKVGSGITPTGGERVYKQEGRPFLRSQNVGWGTLILDDIAFIDDATHATFRDTEIESDDVFLNITGASIGRSAVADSRIQRGNVNQHVCIIRTDPAQLHPRFLNYFLLSTAGQRQIESFQAGGNRQGLNFGQIRSFLLPLPSTPEQHSIAGALSDVDALIGALDQLIGKKRDLKQAAMQQLLTGQTRLPGFHGEWQVKRLGELGKFKNGINKGNQDFGHGFPFVNLMDVFGVPTVSSNSSFGFVNSSAAERELFKLNKGDVLFVCSSVKPKGVGLTTLVCENLPNTVFSGFLVRFSDDGQLAFEFKEHCFILPEFRNRLIASSTVSANTNINQHALRSLELSFPLDKREQTAIAEVLSNMDAELAALEQRRDKTRALKQGMMQELLTGRTRLI